MPESIEQYEAERERAFALMPALCADTFEKWGKPRHGGPTGMAVFAFQAVLQARAAELGEAPPALPHALEWIAGAPFRAHAMNRSALGPSLQSLQLTDQALRRYVGEGVLPVPHLQLTPDTINGVRWDWTGLGGKGLAPRLVSFAQAQARPIVAGDRFHCVSCETFTRDEIQAARNA